MKRLKTILLASLILISSASQANPNHHHGYHNRSDWLVPIVIGSAVGYAISRPQPVIIQNPPNIYQQPVPYGYHYEQLLDANCNCYRLVLVQN